MAGQGCCGDSSFFPGETGFFGTAIVIFIDTIGLNAGQHGEIVAFVRPDRVTESLLPGRIRMGNFLADQLQGFLLLGVVQVIESCQVIAVIGTIFAPGTINGFDRIDDVTLIFDVLLKCQIGRFIHRALPDIKRNQFPEGFRGNINFEFSRQTPEIYASVGAVVTGILVLL